MTAEEESVEFAGAVSPRRFLSVFHLTLDASGRHLLAYRDAHQLKAVNLTTGHQTPITAAQIPYLDGAYNTAAW